MLILHNSAASCPRLCNFRLGLPVEASGRNVLLVLDAILGHTRPPFCDPRPLIPGAASIVTFPHAHFDDDPLSPEPLNGFDSVSSGHLRRQWISVVDSIEMSSVHLGTFPASMRGYRSED